MEVSNEIKEDIRKTQTDLKNAIRVHQVWVARLLEDANNLHIKCKVKEAEKDIIAIGQTQKRVVERLRRELELYQQRLKARNKQVNSENDHRYVAQQLRDHQIQHRNKNRAVSLLKPSVLTEIHIKTENNNSEVRPPSNDVSEDENEIKLSNDALYEKENANYSENDEASREKYPSNYAQYSTSVRDSRSNFVNALNKVKESFIEGKIQREGGWTPRAAPRSDSDSSPSPSPSPPLAPPTHGPLSQEAFLRLMGLVTPRHKEVLEKKRNERRKRSTTSTNRNEFIYGNFDMAPKRKKYNQFPYLQSHSTPPTTRSAKLRKQQQRSHRSSRDPSPSASSGENKGGWGDNKPAWAAALPAGLTVEPVFSPATKSCHGCGRNDVPSLLVRCACGAHLHTGCGTAGRCPHCSAPLPDPAPAHPVLHAQIFRDKLIERKRLQEKNIQLCSDLRKLDARAASLKESLDERNAKKRELLAAQINTQRHLQKLLDFVGQFKETSVSLRSTSLSDSGSELSKSNDD